VSVQSPAAVGCLRQQYPGAVGQGLISGSGGHDSGQLAHHRKLLRAVKRAGVGQHLDPDVVLVTVDVGERTRWQLVDERGGVLAEQRDVRYPLHRHDSGGEIRGQFVLVGERARDCIDVDHRHCWLLRWPGIDHGLHGLSVAGRRAAKVSA